MSKRFPQVKPLEIIRALERLGFVRRRQTGGHLILRHPETKRIVTVPLHVGDLKRGLIFSVIKQAGISQEELLDVL